MNNLQSCYYFPRTLCEHICRNPEKVLKSPQELPPTSFLPENQCSILNYAEWHYLHFVHFGNFRKFLKCTKCTKGHMFFYIFPHECDFWKKFSHAEDLIIYFKLPAGLVTTSRPLYHIYGLVVPYLWLWCFKYFSLYYYNAAKSSARKGFCAEDCTEGE